jgi:hypothetical protein
MELHAQTTFAPGEVLTVPIGWKSDRVYSPHSSWCSNQNCPGQSTELKFGLFLQIYAVTLFEGISGLFLNLIKQFPNSNMFQEDYTFNKMSGLCFLCTVLPH